VQLPYNARDVSLEIAGVKTSDEGCPGWTIATGPEATGWTTAAKAATEGGIQYGTAVVYVEVERLHSHFVDK